MTRAWRWVGERALLRAFPDPVPTANAKALALASRVSEEAFAGVEDLVPGARTLLVVLAHGAEPADELIRLLERGVDVPPTTTRSEHEIPVAYGGVDGPDLADVAAHAGISESEVVRLHQAASYTVAFIGFSPGFPYLLGMPDALATPRLATPRSRIAAGSVGIGGAYTGIYPQATAGGWRLIGRTDASLFDPSGDPPALLAPGAAVRFVAT